MHGRSGTIKRRLPRAIRYRFSHSRLLHFIFPFGFDFPFYSSFIIYYFIIIISIEITASSANVNASLHVLALMDKFTI